MMDITNFIASHREVLFIGDHNTYRAQLSRQILATRKRLGQATNKREKFAPKPVTAEDVGRNYEFAHLLLLTSERAWAHAMHIKTSHSEDTSGRGITGSTRNHIISRLAKAAKIAARLVDILRERDTSKASTEDVLEGRAYVASLAGSEEFEKRSGGQRNSEISAGARWQKCLQQFSEARVIYAAFYERGRSEVFRDILANTIDPTIRYAAYQASLSRTIAIPTVAKRYFPNDDAELVEQVEGVDQYALKDRPVAKAEVGGSEAASQDVPNSVTWRGRKANIVDAAIGQALANVGAAEARLRSHLSANTTASNRDRAAAYDEILVASQDVTDATKRATDELEKERVDESDPRMQDLRVTSLAVNYNLVSWRVGRNRVLIGKDDGLTLETRQQKKPKRLRKDGGEYPNKEEGRGQKLARLRERTVLYNATIQSVQSVKDLRGAVRDAKFVAELDSQASYFRALKCLNVAYSHSLLDNHVNALALLERAQQLAHHSTAQSAKVEKDSPPTLNVDSTASSALQTHISALLLRTHAMVEIHKLEANSATAAAKNLTSAAPLVSNLKAYPPPGTQVDLKNLVTYPPRIEPVPVKPIFLDVAWEYIDYPGGNAEVAMPEEPSLVNGSAEEKPQPEKKKGWFGFGR